MKMKYSIRRQVTALFIALLVFILGGVLIINSGFLVSYYLSHKTEDLVRTYNEIDRTLQEGSLTDLAVLKTILVIPGLIRWWGRSSPGISTVKMYCEETAILQCTDQSHRG